MDIPVLKRILTAFADTPAHLDLAKGQLLLQLRDEVIAASLTIRDGRLYITEADDTLPAEQWVIKRVARLPILADRILTYLPYEQHYVETGGELLDSLDVSPEEKPQRIDNAIECAGTVLGRRSAGTTSILYLTSDAGEGKTTLIHHLARAQAEAYKAKTTDWLLLPVALGGRPFLRLDDVIIGALVNKYRYQLLYYEAFIELVRLGVLIPALDGFEEMFVEDASGDAVSALGNLVQGLSSSGTVLVSARRAYFEYKSFHTQSRLFDSLANASVTFSRLSLKRWTRDQFLTYAEKRGITDGSEIYREVCALMGHTHPLLTRAVLVKRLLDIASSLDDRKALFEQLSASPDDYFAQFVDSILEREVSEKWIDRSGEPFQPLLGLEGHRDLLSLVAREMWTNRSSAIREDALRAIGELFCDGIKASPIVARQIVERLLHHALIAQVEKAPRAYSFDHEEFYHYFLGYALGGALLQDDQLEAMEILRTAALPAVTMDVAVRFTLRGQKEPRKILDSLVESAQSEGPVSFIRENCGGLIIRMLDAAEITDVRIENVSFPSEFLVGKTLRRIHFVKCYFQPSGVENATLENCTFETSEFERLELARSATIRDVVLLESRCRALVPAESEAAYYDPDVIDDVLGKVGVVIKRTSELFAPPQSAAPLEQRLVVLERAFRVFLRSTEVNEGTFRQKLGERFSEFVDNVVPVLLKVGILAEVKYHGHGKGRRFRLQVRMEVIFDGLTRCQGKFDTFVELVKPK